MRWLLALVLVFTCSELAVPPEVIKRPVTATECLAWVINDEARGESLKGARAVLDVVLRRMKLRKKTACQVVAEPKQFSGYKPGVFLGITQEMLTKYEVVNKMPPSVPNCEYFHANYVSPYWNNGLVKCKQIGNHIFYRAKPKEKK